MLECRSRRRLRGVPITYAHQREQNGLAHALLTVEDHVDDDSLLRDNIFHANFGTSPSASAPAMQMLHSSSKKSPGKMHRGMASVRPTLTARLQLSWRNPRTRNLISS